jgi:pyruvate decarboxylase
VWTDYSTVGYSILLSQKKMITVEENRVTICGGMTFGCVNMGDFLSALADVVTENEAAFVNFQRMYVPLSVPPPQPETQQIRTVVLFKHIQEYIDSNTAIIAEVGDTWFNSQKLKLPVGCEYEMQIRYGSIGWSVGAVLGYVKACGADKRVLGIIGDGSFQMTAQEISTMIRYNLNPVIILINNGGYTIEVEIHDGPYNVIKNWDYTAFSRALRNDSGKLFTAKCHTEPDFVAALAEAKKLTDHICFIEVITHKDDCSKELLEWGSRVAACNGRRPNPKWRQM